MQRNTQTKVANKDSHYTADISVYKTCSIHPAGEKKNKTPKKQKLVPFEVTDGNLHHFEMTTCQSVTHTRKGSMKGKELTGSLKFSTLSNSETYSNTQRDGYDGCFFFFFVLSPSSLWNRGGGGKRGRRKKKEKKKKEGKKRKRRKKQSTIENLLTGSAVTGMHLSIQGTHPCRTSKTGLGSLPYSHGLKPRLGLRQGTE